MWKFISILTIKYKPQLMSIIKLGDNASFHTSVLSLMLYPYQRLLAHQKKKGINKTVISSLVNLLGFNGSLVFQQYISDKCSLFI